MPSATPDGDMTDDRLKIETAEKGLLAISALILAFLFALPAFGALNALAAGEWGVLEVVYPVVMVAALIASLYFGRAYRLLKRRM